MTVEFSFNYPSAAVNKKYVDDKFLPKAISNFINMNDIAILNLANGTSLKSAANKQYVYDTFLPKLGGQMQGPIDMNNRNITGIPNIPSSDSSAVDDKTSKITIHSV